MTTKLVTYVTKAKEGTFSYRKSDETEFQSSKMEGQECSTLKGLKSNLATALDVKVDKLSLISGTGGEKYTSGEEVEINYADE